MPRMARVVIPGYPHHITQRGNYRQIIFSNNLDRKKYLSLLKKESLEHNLSILVYCLMDNHIHLIVIPENDYSMSNFFKYLNMNYSQYYNTTQKGLSGHLFQGRYFSSVLDYGHLLMCALYIEKNPLRASIVNKPWEYEWSSARLHCMMETKDLLGVNKLFNFLDINQNQWRTYLEEEENKIEIKKLQGQTIKGLPIGNNDFINDLEIRLNRSLSARLRGRPKLNKTKASII